VGGNIHAIIALAMIKIGHGRINTNDKKYINTIRISKMINASNRISMLQYYLIYPDSLLIFFFGKTTLSDAVTNIS
jgi:hypothetical protein